MKTNFDMKISKNFTGRLDYKKTDYLTEGIRNNEISYELRFHQGKLISVLGYYTNDQGEVKSFISDPNKWNEDFWKKAPEFIHCDECSWKRTDFNVSLDGFKTFNFLGWNRTYCIV